MSYQQQICGYPSQNIKEDLDGSELLAFAIVGGGITGAFCFGVRNCVQRLSQILYTRRLDYTRLVNMNDREQQPFLSSNSTDRQEQTVMDLSGQLEQSVVVIPEIRQIAQEQYDREILNVSFPQIGNDHPVEEIVGSTLEESV